MKRHPPAVLLNGVEGVLVAKPLRHILTDKSMYSPINFAKWRYLILFKMCATTSTVHPLPSILYLSCVFAEDV